MEQDGCQLESTISAQLRANLLVLCNLRRKAKSETRSIAALRGS
jgi:hypothetical protein